MAPNNPNASDTPDKPNAAPEATPKLPEKAPMTPQEFKEAKNLEALKKANGPAPFHMKVWLKFIEYFVRIRADRQLSAEFFTKLEDYLIQGVGLEKNRVRNFLNSFRKESTREGSIQNAAARLYPFHIYDPSQDDESAPGIDEKANDILKLAGVKPRKSK